ncbi:LytTR family two component transcriptional regulator [Flavobacterium aquaticum]|uniref:LytTR family two component transcriptional regulator n=1 Tax=Flavobacterium aquaticum TaxID=1236486 RepID=A0A327YXV0_9FLAO|nr:LytTR family DNA-binding domain-containing protein [Flavobacterium aquaticum]RAK25386.1 LytTR family two component transcriptional regulator [Flavobacterium aquaticum]
MQKHNVLLVEDEESNLELLKYFIINFIDNLNIIGEATNVEEALIIYKNTKPDIIILDIQLQEKDAFDFLDLVNFGEFEIIFVTAYESYALKAFKYNVIDYILKPFAIEDLKKATEKCIRRIEERKLFDSKNFEKNNNSNIDSNNTLSIPSIDRVDIINKSDIIFCKSDGRYTTFYLKNNSEYVASKNLGEYETMLEHDGFFRIHYSYMVNLNNLITINKKNSYYFCDMINNISLPIAKRRVESLRVYLKFEFKKKA